MSRKVAVIALITLFVCVLLLLPLRTKQLSPMSQEASSKNVEQIRHVIQPSLIIADENLSESESRADKTTLFPSLEVQVIHTERGFRLQFNNEQFPSFSGTVNTSTNVIHLLSRHDYADNGLDDTLTR